MSMLMAPLSADKEGLIRWACKHRQIDEQVLRKLYPDIELYCAQHAVSIGRIISLIVDMCNFGMKLKTAFAEIKERAVWE